MAGRFLLDTHVVVEIGVRGGLEAMPAKVRRILENTDTELLVSAASEAEIAIKHRIGKLDLNKEELALICASASIASLPLRRQHVERLFDLPLHHNDPFDRLILSTALSEDLPLISRDRQFRSYKRLRVVW